MLKNLFFHEKLMNIFENTRLFERENDYEQIKNAEELYDRILKKLESAKVAISYVSLQPECDLKLYFVSELRDQNRNDIAWFIPKINTIMLNSKLGKNKELFDNKEYTQILKNMREPVIHELVHYLDYFRASFEEYKDGEYYNAPEEFNAYYLQIASGVYKALENIKINIQMILINLKKPSLIMRPIL